MSKNAKKEALLMVYSLQMSLLVRFPPAPRLGRYKGEEDLADVLADFLVFGGRDAGQR